MDEVQVTVSERYIYFNGEPFRAPAEVEAFIERFDADGMAAVEPFSFSLEV